LPQEVKGGRGLVCAGGWISDAHESFSTLQRLAPLHRQKLAPDGAQTVAAATAPLRRQEDPKNLQTAPPKPILPAQGQW